jgi:SAM-dependent methyltransferase
MPTVPTLKRERLTAEDYAYRLPDHFVLHEKENTRASLFPMLHAYYIGRVAEIIKSRGAKTVLDAGCGDGWSSMTLANSGLDVVGTDWSANGIDHAKRLVKNARFFHGDITEPEFKRSFPDQFDAVSFIEVLEHIKPDECADTLRNITSPLKKGGILVITTPSENFPNTHDNHYRHFNEMTLRQTIGEAGGLSIEAIEGYGDVRAENAHYRVARFVENRYFTIKPALSYLLKRNGNDRIMRQTPFDRCHGLIATVIKD